MKKSKKHIVSLFLVVIIIFYTIPFNISAIENANNEELKNRFNITIGEESPTYVKEIAEKSQLFDEFEVISLREENVKHYALSDGTLKAVVYPYSVHEKCEDGTWIEKDNVQYLLNRRGEDNDSISESNGNRSYYQISDNVIGDTYVNSSSPSTNYSNSLQLYVGSSTKRAYISLPTPSLPSNATINGSELDIMYYFYPSITSGYVTVGVYEVTSPWSVSTLNWNAVQYGGSGAIGSNAIVTRNLHASNYISQSSPGQDTLDITSAVQDWYAGVSNYGIALEYTGGASTSAVIYSLESGYYPLYTIYYSLDSLPIENGIYYIENAKWTGKYLQITNNDSPNYSSSGAIAKIYNYNVASLQMWHFTYLHNGYYKIISVKSGLSLSIKNGCSNTNSSNIVQYSYNGSDTQMWEIESAHTSNYSIKPKSRVGTGNDYCVSVNFGIILDPNGTNVNQEKYVNNSDVRDEWIFHTIGSFKYVNYFDSTFVGETSLINNIYLANTFSNLAYSRLCGLSFSMYGDPTQYVSAIADQCSHSANVPCSDQDCGSNCITQHHRNCYRISNQLYYDGQLIQSGYRYVMWSNRSYGTYCKEDGNHQTVSWIAVVYDHRPIMHFLTIDGLTNVKKACMTLNLVHETAHTFNMPDVYDNTGHDVSNATVCVMERFDGATAYAFYLSVLDGTCDAFCDSCSATIFPLIINKISEEMQ